MRRKSTFFFYWEKGFEFISIERNIKVLRKINIINLYVIVKKIKLLS